jgi:hypothetical protein
MPSAHDPAALARHAAEAGDWQLVELIARMLAGRPPEPSTGARRAYTALVLRLGLAGDGKNYDRI